MFAHTIPWVCNPIRHPPVHTKWCTALSTCEPQVSMSFAQVFFFFPYYFLNEKNGGKCMRPCRLETCLTGASWNVIDGRGKRKKDFLGLLCSKVAFLIRINNQYRISKLAWWKTFFGSSSASLFNLLFNSARRDEIRRYTGLNNHEPDEKEMELTNLLKIPELTVSFPFFFVSCNDAETKSLVFSSPMHNFRDSRAFLWTKDGRLLSASLSFRPVILFFPPLLFVPISWCLRFFTIHQILCDPASFFPSFGREARKGKEK